MTGRARSVIIAAIHLALVASLTGKLLIDRRTSPRGWAQTVAYDPDLPIRGRYIQLTLIVPPLEGTPPEVLSTHFSRLVIRGDRVWTAAATEDVGQSSSIGGGIVNTSLRTLSRPVAFFIPEHVKDPSIRPAGEHLWVEVTVPERGPPRPIRLGVQLGDGPITPLDLSAP